MRLSPQKVRVRIAPSPTGYLHIGTARTALYNFLFARKHKGIFVLRIEDTDPERSRKKYELDIMRHLKWLGLEWDEGPVLPTPNSQQDYKGQYGPYRQSERGQIYQKYLTKLLKDKRAFWCFHTKKELSQEKKWLQAQKRPPVHHCEHKNQKPQNKKNKGIIRFNTPVGERIVFDDLIRGKIEFKTDLLGDFSLAKSETEPLYNFAVAVDDWEMKISHVIRGEDHIANTPKQILILKSLGLRIPKYAHLPLILGPDKAKLSKRHGATAVRDYKNQGYLPEALVNFMAFLGWNPGDEREIFNLAQLIQEFSLARVKKGGSIFNIKRLEFLNGYYIRNLSLDEFTEKSIAYLVEAGKIKLASNKQLKTRKRYQVTKTKQVLDYATLKKYCALEQKRVKRLCDIPSALDFLLKKDLIYDPELLIWKKMKLGQVKKVLIKLQKVISKLEPKDFRIKTLERKINKAFSQVSDQGRFLWPLRVALTGQKASPGPFEIMAVLGKEKSLTRIKQAINLC